MCHLNEHIEHLHREKFLISWHRLCISLYVHLYDRLYMIKSEGAHLSFIDVSGLFLWNIKVVKHPIMAHDSESSVPFIKFYCLEPFLNFDLGQTQITIEVLAHHFQE